MTLGKPQKVSIIIPAYNAQSYLDEALKSVIEQDYQLIEPILIDDGSTDRTPEICEQWKQKDSRIVLIRQERKGVSEARNRGMVASTGDLIAFHDADDLMFPNRISSQLSFLEKNPDISIACALGTYITEYGVALGKTPLTVGSREDFYNHLRNNKPIGLLTSSAIIKRQVFEVTGSFRSFLTTAEDIDYWNRAVDNGFLILGQNEILLKYRLHSGSAISRSYFRGKVQYEWVKAAMRARRSNLPEPDFTTFIEDWKRIPVWRNIKWLRKIAAQFYARQAALQILQKRYIISGISLTISLLLMPSYILKRLKAQG